MLSLKQIILAGILAVLLIPAVYAQTHGKLFTKEEADAKFGPVLESVAIDTELLKTYNKKNAPVLMFQIMDQDLVILNNRRDVIHSKRVQAVSKEAIFHAYSNSVIQELVEKGGSTVTYIEKRAEVLSVTNGATTMEMATICPPVCN